ncbi:MAG: phage tail tape measure protein [Oscillospiraceae bacterium]|nr:phage tail tape measure protein [Oscillospiraceae bacterium]
MAKREIGTRLTLDGEAEFKSAVGNINQELKVLASEMGVATSSFDKNNASVADLKNQNAIYQKQLEAQRAKQAEYNKMLEEARAAQSKAAAAVAEAAEKFGDQSKEVKKAEEQLAAANKKLDDYQIGANYAAKAVNQLEAAQKANNEQIDKMNKADFGKFRDGLVNASKAAAAAVTAVATAVGAATTAIVAFAKSSVESGMSFDSSMSQVAATMGTTVDQIGELRDFAQEMGSTTAFSASQAADALNYMALAGYDANSSMEMLPNVLNLAAAGGMELAKASDMITDSQSALGLSFEETNVMVDQMAAAASKTNTSVAQLGDAILTVGGTAKSLSGGTAELSAVLGVMADNGIKGSEAGTHLRNIMLAMVPTTSSAVMAYQRLGVETYDTAGNLRNLEDVFMDLSAAMDEMTDEDKTLYTSMIFNKTDLSAVNALLSTTAERWDEVNTALENAGGAAEAMANTQLDNLEGDITIFKSALEGAQIAISDVLTPSLREFVQFGTNGISQLTAAFKSGGLNGAMSSFGNIISDALAMIGNVLPKAVSAGAALLNALAQGMTSNLPTVFEGLTEAITETLPILTETATTIIVSLADGIISNLPVITDSAMQMIITLAEGIGAALPELVPTVVEVLVNIVDVLIGNINLLVDAALQLVTGLAEGLLAALPVLIGKIPEIITSLVSALLEAVPQIVVTGVQLLTAIINDLPTIIAAIVDALPQIITGIINALLDSIPQLINAGIQLFVALIEGIPTAIVSIVEAVPEIVMAIIDTLMETDWIDVGVQIIKAIASGLVEGVKNVGNLIAEACSGIVDGITNFFGFGDSSQKKDLETGYTKDFTMQLRKTFKPMNKTAGDLGITIRDDLGNEDYSGSYGSSYGGYSAVNYGGAGQGGNIVFNQYNTSPKALSAAELNRQTRQGLQLAYCMR